MVCGSCIIFYLSHSLIFFFSFFLSGARALSEGGLQSLPKLHFPGGALIGDTAGFLNVMKIKGIHNAIKSGMLCAESVFENLEKQEEGDVSPIHPASYEDKFKNSWLYQDIWEVRNVRPAFSNFGQVGGVLLSGVNGFLKGNLPFTLSHPEGDHEATGLAKDYKEIDYPKPDGKISFDLLTNVSRSGTNHNEDQPAHLRLRDSSIPVEHNLNKLGAPEERYFILFYFILFYFILFYFILFYFILFYFILFYFILFYFILFYFILFYFILFYFILFYFILFYFILFYFILFYFILFYFILFYFYFIFLLLFCFNCCFRFCPAGVYEYVDDEEKGGKRLQINFSVLFSTFSCPFLLSLFFFFLQTTDPPTRTVSTARLVILRTKSKTLTGLPLRFPSFLLPLFIFPS